MRIILATLVLALAAACARHAPASSGESAQEASSGTNENAGAATGGAPTIDELREKSRAEVDEAACRAAGGAVRQEGLLGMYRCVKPFADAGRTCRSSSDCEGKCLATGDEKTGESAAGQCQANDSPFGCYAEIVDGKVADAICVD